MNEYAGESLAKKVARVRMYRRTREALLWQGVKLEEVRAIFLPGPDASEVGALKHILGVTADRALAIDRDAGAIKTVKARWPGVHAVCGSLDESAVFRTPLKIWPGQYAHFVHMDLMGNLSFNATKNYMLWGYWCGLNGVFTVTYLRGRELPDSHGAYMKNVSSEFIVKGGSGGEAGKLKKLLAADPARAWSHLTAINMGLLKGVAVRNGVDSDDFDQLRLVMNDVMQDCFTPLGTYCYRAETSPMGVLVAQHVSKAVLESDGYATLRYRGGRNTSSVISKDPMDELIAEADSLSKDYGREAALEILGISAGTLGAYRAHNTRGTYA